MNKITQTIKESLDKKANLALSEERKIIANDIYSDYSNMILENRIETLKKQIEEKGDQGGVKRMVLKRLMEKK